MVGSTVARVLGVFQEVTPVQAGDVADSAPPLDLPEQLLTFWVFVFVMLIVPWILARESSTLGPPADGGSFAGAISGPLFSSDRERRLWLWILAVMVAIYSTLSPAQEVAAALRERNLLRVSIAAFLLLVGVVIAVKWAKTRPDRREIGAALGITAVYLTTLIRLPVPEARSHLFEYGLVAMLIYQALAVVATALLGWLDEGIQWLLPNRVYDLLDVGFNALAGLAAVSAILFMEWARRWDALKRIRRRAH